MSTELVIPGVPSEETNFFYGVSNYPYFVKKVSRIRKGECPFCQIDTQLNVEIPGIQNPSWRVWENNVSRSVGLQNPSHQFVIPLRRHVHDLDEVWPEEWADLKIMTRALEDMFDIHGGQVLIRTGDARLSGRSESHFHVHYYAPNGSAPVTAYFCKGPDEMARKHRILQTWIKMLAFEESGMKNVADPVSPEEWELVKDTLTIAGRC